MNRPDSLLAEARASDNPELPQPEPFVGLLAFARTLHATRHQHDHKYRLEPARTRLQEERADEAARHTFTKEGA